MNRSPAQLRRDALRIWNAAVDAVRSPQLVRGVLHVEDGDLVVGQQRLHLDQIGRIAVVGAGKAGVGMAAAVEEVLGPELMAEKRLAGWINVPADCVRPLHRITLHAARPAGINEPRPEGAAGSEEILRLVASLDPEDLCLCLISGGGSALLPAPVEAISLEDKLAVTRFLSAAGANIEQLNTVRKHLSRIKGGGLLRACRAGQLVSLIISDVLGDPLELIASGPTVEDSSSAEDALAVLERFDARAAGIAPSVFDYLAQGHPSTLPPPTCGAMNLIIGNNSTAVDAAAREARSLGFVPAIASASKVEGEATDIGRQLASRALQMRTESGPNCLISGGEPVVTLAGQSIRGIGGRNQQLVLAALDQLFQDGSADIAILSGGTDGEDGPTDAAGALLNAEVVATAQKRQLSPGNFLARNDAYHFFEPLGALIKTGPTHTNVCDVRVVVVNHFGESHINVAAITSEK